MFPATLTCRQPFASLIMHRVKNYETRSWHLDIRNHPLPLPIFIHSARSRGGSFLPTYTKKHGIRNFPMGQILGIAVISHSHPTNTLTLTHAEAAMGDFTPGRYAWEIHSTYLFPKPVPCPGAQGLWRIPQHIRPTVLEQIDAAGADWLLDRIPGREALAARGYKAQAEKYQHFYADDALVIADKLPAVMMDAPYASTTTQDWYKWLPPRNPVAQCRAS